MSRTDHGVREKILDAAMGLLRTQGVKFLTQPQVAKAAGVLQSHLTYYFPHRTDLLLAVARHSATMVFQELQGFFASQALPTSDDETRARVFALVRVMMQDRERTRVLLGLLVAADDDPALREVMIENMGLVRSVVALGLRRAIDDPDVDVVLATLWGLGVQQFLVGDRRDARQTDALLARLPVWMARAPSPDDR